MQWAHVRNCCSGDFIPKKEDLMSNTGTVKWFNPTKGYGFITPEEGGNDVFVHISEVEKSGLGRLDEGQVITYEIVTNRNKTSAANLKLVG